VTDRALLPVRNDRQDRAEDGSNPVDPVVVREMAIDDSRSKRTGWVDAGCRNGVSVKVGTRTEGVDKIL